MRNITKELKPFWNYYGGKWRSARRYPEPIYDEIVEPFAGAAGYSLRYYERQILLIDEDPVICAVWQWLIDATFDDVMSLPLLDPEDCVDYFDLPNGARWLIGFLLNTGTAAPSKKPSSWMRKCLTGEIEGAESKLTSFWSEKRRARIAEQVPLIKHWRIFNWSYDIAPNGEATWFVDPPYQKAGKFYKYNSSGIDFKHLGLWCREREGQVIVCENEGADWLPFEFFANFSSTPGKQKKKKKSAEVIWIKAT